MELCTSCQSDKLVEIQGELTCTSCGTVVLTHMIQDTLDYMPYSDQDNYNTEQTEVRDIEDLKIFWLEIYSNAMKKFVIEIVNDTSEHESLFRKKDKRRCLIALALYYVGMYYNRSMSIQQVCRQVDTDWKKTLAFLPKVLPLWSRKKWYIKLNNKKMAQTELLSRAVFDLTVVDDELKRPVLRVASNVYERVRHYPGMNVAKSHTLMYCCIYIGCQVNHIKINRKKFCEHVHISLPTLNHHEDMIQSILKSQKCG